jgi:hypothetical protein
MLWCRMHSTDRLIESMLREMACAVWTPVDVMEVDGKVECYAETRWMPRRQRAKGVLIRSFVRF